MKKGVKILHICYFLSLVTLLAGYKKFYQAILSFQLFFESNTYTGYYLKELSDIYISFFAFLIFNFLLFLFRKKILFLRLRSRPSNIYIILLVYLLLFAPFLSGLDPNFSRNQSVTALLPPFSKVEILYLKNNDAGQKYKEYKKLKPDFFRENIIVARSSELINSEWIIKSGNNIKKIPLKDVESSESHTYICGSDELGRDVYSRLVYSARYSLIVGLGAVLISIVIGVSLGFISGFYGKFADIFLSRITEILLAFPAIFLIIFILSLFGNNIFIIIVILGFTGWMSLFKIVRNETVSAMNQDYFISASMLGLKVRHLAIKELLPVIFFPLTVNIIFQYGAFILAESALGFLGVGIGQELPSWGRMIHSGQVYLYSAWWLTLFPSIMLILTLLSFNSLGNFFSFNFSRTNQ